jgi:hypothetical protein
MFWPMIGLLLPKALLNNFQFRMIEENMWFEDLLLLLMLASGVFFIGIPGYKLISKLIPKKTNPLEEAKQRLEHAKLEAQAARLNKETEKVYSSLYEETIEDADEQEQKEYRRKL